MIKILGKLLVVLGVAALVPVGFATFQDMGRRAEYDNKIAELTSEKAALQEKLFKLNIEYRGYQKSVPSIPDSVRKAQAGIISNKYKTYNKRIRGMEIRQKEITRLIGRNETMKGESLGRSGNWPNMVGGGGLALILLGVVLIRRGSHGFNRT